MKRILLFAIVCTSLSLSVQAAAVEGMILLPEKLAQGNEVSATVTTFTAGAGDLEPRGGEPVTVHLVNSAGEPILQLYDGQTGPDGIVEISFRVPSTLKGGHTVRVDTQSGSFEVNVTIVRGPAILLETDKPVYQPGQTIKGRALLVNNELAPITGDVEIVITDGKGIRVGRFERTVNEFGVADFSLPLANELNMGTWKITAMAGDSTTELAVQVDRYVLPQFTVDVELARDWFLPDEEITGTIRSVYFFGKPVQGEATIRAEKYIGEWTEYATITVSMVDGAGEFTLPPTGWVAGTAEEGGDSAATIEFTVTDTGDHSEQTNRIVKIASSPVGVQLIALERTLKPRMPFSFLVITETPSGIPQDREVSLFVTFQGDFPPHKDNNQEFEDLVATVDGRATVTYEVPEGALSLHITGELNEQGRTARHTISVYGSHSPSASFLHLSREGEGQVQIGEEVFIQATTTHGGTLFWEVLRSGRVVRTGGTRERTIRFTATPEMMPRVDVVGYILNPGNELACDTLGVPVALDTPLAIDVHFSETEGQPGQEVTLEVDVQQRALVGIAVVDESLLYLAEERLTLGSVFAELERRFMTPQVEIHIDEDPWSPVPIEGARETLEAAGLAIGHSDGITVPGGVFGDPWLRGGFGDLDWAEGGPPPNAGPGDVGGGGNDSLAEVQRVRQLFPETWVWEPLLVTDDSGKAQLSLTCPDSITTWNLRALASTFEGVAFAEGSIKVFQEFFVEPDVPVEVVRGEVFPLKIKVYNYAEVAQEIFLELEGDAWFELVDPASGWVQVEPNEVTSLEIRISPTQAGTFPLHVTGRGKGTEHADAVIRQVRVVPEGVPFTTVVNGQVSAENAATLDLTIPHVAVPDSGRVVVAITPSLVAQGLTNLDDLLGMPYGCGEQNMIFLAPDVEVLRYLTATGENYPEIWATAEHYINVGYQRQLTFGRSDGSFSAFGEQDEKGSLYLTAFVLSTFAVAREVRDIDPAVTAEAATWLAAHQSPGGSWEPFGFIHHNELLGGMDGTYALTAFVAKALAEYDPQSVPQALESARAYLAANRTQVAEQPYPLAMAAYALSKIPNGEADLEATLDLLLPLAKVADAGIYWEPFPVETTAYAALALLGAGKPQAGQAIEFIASQRGALGGFGSTQDTVVAFRALTEAAVVAQREVAGSIDLTVGGEVVHTFVVNEGNYDLLQTVELPGGTEGRLVMRGTGKVGWQVAKHFNLPGQEIPPAQNMLIQVAYETDHVAVDDIIDVLVTLNYPGPRERTNMVIADVGVPTGFEVVRESLDALVDEGIASRVEVAIRKVIIYIPELVKNQRVSFTILVRATFPVDAAAVPSTVYDYYEPDERGIDPGTGLSVGDVPFLRGDTNRDQNVDIADAVATLEYLFLGKKITCQDAADTNDDGSLNIADPVFLLMYLFVDGAPPAEPWPDPGDDPTPDGLGCAS